MDSLWIISVVMITVLKYAVALSFSLAGPWNNQYFSCVVLWGEAYNICKEKFNCICNVREAVGVEAFLEFSKALALLEVDIAIRRAVLREKCRLNEVLLSLKLFFQEIHFRSIDCI